MSGIASIKCASRRAFTLVELLLAVTISAMLLAAVLTVTAGLARDRRSLMAHQASGALPQGLLDLLRWDLTNARTMANARDGHLLVLVGHGGIDAATLEPHSRLTRVIYRIVHSGSTSILVREQQYLDDPLRPMSWREAAAVGVNSVLVSPSGFGAAASDSQASPGDLSGDGGPASSADFAHIAAVATPNHVRLRIDMGKININQEWVIR